MYGSGLLKGLGVTFKHWFQREVTEQYPEQRPDLAPASHGFFEWDPDRCICCGMCVRACPNQVITLKAEKNEAGKRVPVSYDMNIAYCLFCGLCIEACPTKTLRNANNFEISVYHHENTDYEFMDPLPHEMNDAFNKVQEEYWSKKRPGGNPIGAPQPYVAPKPAAKPAAKPADAAKPAPAAKPAAEAKAAPAKEAAPVEASEAKAPEAKGEEAEK
jgi:NADH-quinone oxidoreductase subunit I